MPPCRFRPHPGGGSDAREGERRQERVLRRAGVRSRRQGQGGRLHGREEGRAGDGESQGDGRHGRREGGTGRREGEGGRRHRREEGRAGDGEGQGGRRHRRQEGRAGDGEGQGVGGRAGRQGEGLRLEQERRRVRGLSMVSAYILIQTEV